ncbi:hypothetical protein [Pontibacter korlensis]|uniref:hypothetical protein n=1 Tax=Pontibacter korlensis TaxID=400092 RepID=UPI000698B531|nr:hypothetical protein [Pontibacter korlensis]
MKHTLPFIASLLLVVAIVMSCRQEPKRMPDTLPDVYGYVTDIKRTANNGSGAMAVVAIKALEGVEANYDDASVKIDEHTLLEDQTGEPLTLAELREGHEIQAWFDGDVLASKPVQGRAKAVRIKR